jgi:hypothetical protein
MVLVKLGDRVGRFGAVERCSSRSLSSSLSSSGSRFGAGAGDLGKSPGIGRVGVAGGM